MTAAPTTTVPPTTTTTVPPTTTTTLSEEELAAIEYEEDAKAITTLWRRYSDSWATTAGGTQYITDNNHPLIGCSGPDFRDSIGSPTNYEEEVIVDQDTIERDDDWPMPKGENPGFVAEGRIYIFSAKFTRFTLAQEFTAEVHTVIDPSGAAYFFFDCGF